MIEAASVAAATDVVAAVAMPQAAVAR